MKRVLAYLLLDWNMMRRDRADLLWAFVMPFVFMLFFGNVFRAPDRDPSQQRIALMVRDDDRSILSKTFISLLDSTRFVVSFSDSTGDIRTLHLPAGFQDSVMARRHVEITRIQGKGSDDPTIAGDAGILRALVRFHGALAAADVDSSVPNDSVSARLDAALRVPVQVHMDSRWAGLRGLPSGFRQSVPGNLTMFLLMTTVIGAATSVAVDRNAGTLRRALAGPLSPRLLIACRIVPRFILAIGQMLLLIAGARLFFGWTPGPSWPAFLAVGALFALVCVGLGVFLGSRFSTAPQAAMASWITGMVMGSLGGAWWPLEVVPSGMRTLAHVLPTAWAMDGFHAVSTYGGGLREVTLPLVVLGGMALVSLGFAARELRVK